MSPEMARRMFFVVGAPRSGTTLLTRMLNVHPDVHARPEPHLLPPLAHLGYYAYAEKAPYDPFQAHEAARAFVADLPHGEADYLDALRGYTDTLYGRMLATTGRRYLLDKTPANALILPFVARLYPDAVYAVITRHPFAIFSSYAESFFDGDWEAAHAFNPILQRYLPAIAAFLRDRPVPRLHHLRYEALVTTPEAELKGLCATADLRFEPGMVRYGGTDLRGQGLGDPVGVKAHDRPTTTSVHKWAEQVAGRPDRIALLRRMIARVDDADLAAWGFDRSSLWAPLGEVDPDAAARARRAARRFDRHHLERRLLLHLRRNIRHNALGRALGRVRFYCDVLLRP